MSRAFYSADISVFLTSSTENIMGILSIGSPFSDDQTQKLAWLKQIEILRTALIGLSGKVFFEYVIPRMGRRIDVVLIVGPMVFILEFKVGEKEFSSAALEQVWDYALDLKNFHETSHNLSMVPVLVCTEARVTEFSIITTAHNDKLLYPIKSTALTLREVIDKSIAFVDDNTIDSALWEQGRYCPTPTIVEAAMALYSGHSVAEISRSDAGATNLSITSKTIDELIARSKTNNRKSICFLTGVPGAGKTLVGLDVATSHINKTNALYSVFLSGNGPLVAILREALTRDKVRRVKELGKKTTKGVVMSEVKMFIQNVHNFRDDCLDDTSKPPIEHVALFDEAQRAWDLDQTSKFMIRKKGIPGFNQSEPEYLISCMDRHEDWAVIVCLVGGGQEINTGEAGISEWINAINRSFPHWDVYISPQLLDSEYGAGTVIESLKTRLNVQYNINLHLSVSMRSFRAEHVSLFVKNLLDINTGEAKRVFSAFKDKFPIVLTRDLSAAKKWLKAQARGSERYGIVVSSQAERLKPHAIDVKSPMDPIHWFLDNKEDVRSSFFLEDVATEFAVQGLELDWICVTWDADFRYQGGGWEHWSFVGDKWHHIHKEERKAYQKNAYRVLLTRARQGMVIVVPHGDPEDHTRKSQYYDPTYEYLASIGIPVIE